MCTIEINRSYESSQANNGRYAIKITDELYNIRKVTRRSEMDGTPKGSITEQRASTARKIIAKLGKIDLRCLGMILQLKDDRQRCNLGRKIDVNNYFSVPVCGIDVHDKINRTESDKRGSQNATQETLDLPFPSNLCLETRRHYQGCGQFNVTLSLKPVLCFMIINQFLLDVLNNFGNFFFRGFSI